MSMQKGEIKKVFEMIKQGQVDEAFQIMKRSSSLKYDTYDNRSIYVDNVGGSSGRTVKWYARVISSTVNGCKGPVKELKGLTFEGLSEEQGSNLKSKVSEIKSGFNRGCNKDQVALGNQVVEQVKKMTTVDFSDVVAKSKVEFKKEVVRLNTEAKSLDQKIESDEKSREDKKVAYRNSPEYFHKQMCDAQVQIRAAKRAIKKENEAAKHSGFVDKVKMHRAGRFIQTYGNLLKKDKVEYKKRFGKPWSGSCK